MTDDLYTEDGQRIKERTGKLKWDLLDLAVLEELVQVLTHGAEKYSAHSWQRVPQTEYFAALMRHLTAHQKGEELDQESKLPHLAHALCDLYFLLWFDMQDRKHDEWYVEEGTGDE